ncbi:aldose 1-epimerase family protein [Cellulomonas sp. URHE0023]|uniref:aldose 1-epimerase family protein n=1 Tax=Cellulomonas sp. URHE0023 TaxID=1380354 RepID=UPI000488700B|nr:aldose 1-epimerase family protein [Cellulomonas sp. URHE0023]
MTSTPLPPLPTGRQHVLELGDQRAVVAAVGASLREYTVGGRDVVLPYPQDAMAPAFSGTVLAPWPNRLRDGLYEFEGVTYDVPLNEHDRQTALHGLVAHQTFSTVDAGSDSVTLELVVVPTSGYPWPVRLRVTYALASTGLRVQTDVTNLGTSTAPFGLGFHPWLSPGDGPVDEATLRVDATRHVTVDTRLLPTGSEALAGRFDLRSATLLRGIALDDAWLQLVRDEDGLSWVHFGGSDGRTVSMWADAGFEAWQVCTGDFVAAIKRRGVAVEPMTCIADAFRTGENLIRLAPGESRELTWGLQLV